MAQNKPHKIEMMLFLAAVAILGISLYFLSPSIIGFVIKEVGYGKDVNLVVTSNGNYTLELDDIGELKSFMLDGRVTSYGRARVYIENNGLRYLVFDSTRLAEENKTKSNETLPITGFAVEDEEENNDENETESDEDKKDNNKKPKWEGDDEFIVNGTIEINLSEYFVDEDGDKLTYSASDAESLAVSVDGEIATIEPKTSQNLNTTITFIASDGIDSKSHTVKLIVIVEKEEVIENKAPRWNSETESFIVNTSFSLDLMQYFIDDDNNALTFSVSDAADIEEKLDNNALTLNALKDNFNATITITASDSNLSTDKIVQLIIPLTNEAINATIPINETPIINETNITIEKTIKINLSYNKNTVYDANDNGEESVNGVVDLSVAGTEFNWDADKPKLCTRWEVYNAEESILTKFCNGNSDCCAFFGLLPANEDWSDVYYSTYGKDGAGYDNIVYAQVVYYDVNVSIDNPKSEIYNSEWANLSVKFFDDEIDFFDECIETCSLTGLNKSSYTLVFEIEDDALLRINRIKYSLSAGAKNNAPVLLQNFSVINMGRSKNATINLSEYFNDPDGDALAYSYYKPDNITILFDNDIATIVPDKAFEGIVFTYLAANDSESSVSSDVFMLNISAIPAPITFNLPGEALNVTAFCKADGIEIEAPYQAAFASENSFGYTFDENELIGIANSSKISCGYKIESDGNYSVSSNPYMLERPLGYYKAVANQMGEIEFREVKRFIDFSDIFRKESNLHGELNYSFSQQNNSWSIEFFSIFDLDPSFIDDTDSNWDSGTFNNMARVGIGTDAILKSSGMNTSGSYASKIFDAGDLANWASITIATEANYGIEVGRAKDDSRNAELPSVNTSELLLLLHFNNESALGENDSLFYDFSEEAGSGSNNGTCFAGRCPSYNFTNKRLGQGAIGFDGVNDYVNITGGIDNMADFTFAAWVYWKGLPNSAGRFQRIFDFGNSTAPSSVNGQYMFLTPSGSNNVHMFAITKAGYLNNYGVNSSTALPVNQWVHVAVTLKGNVSTLYRNGVFDANASVLLSPGNLSLGHNWLGRSKFSTDPYFNGAMDEVAMWNRSLSADEIRNLYLRGAASLNVSARACDDPECSGDSWANIQPTNITSGFSIPLDLTTGSYFQYNITYSRNATGLNGTVIVKNVSIDASISSDEASSIIMDIDSEIISIESYVEVARARIPSPATIFKSNRTFGFVHRESGINTNLGRRGIPRSLWDNKIYMSLNASDYTRSQNIPYMLERNLAGQTKLIKNEIGQLEARQLKRFIDFSAIFGKDINLYNTTQVEINQTICYNAYCTNFTIQPINQTIKIPRTISHSFIKQGKSWIIEFFNIFDLDPSFIDDTDSNWNSGTFDKMYVRGTGATANLTGENQSGHFASQIFDSGVASNWTNISIVTESAYGIEIGRYLNDSNLKDSYSIGINTSGLVLLMHFNNESALGENSSLIRDFSIDVNPEREGSRRNNGTRFGTFQSFNKTDYVFGKSSIEFSGNNDWINISNHSSLNPGNITVCAWAKRTGASDGNTFQALVMKIECCGANPKFGYALYLSNENNQVAWEVDGTARFQLTATVQPLNWNHYCGTFNTSVVELFVNGVSRSSTTGANMNANGNGYDLLIGVDTDGQASGYDGDFNGEMDEIAIWNRSLSLSEIQNLYRRGAWRMNLSVRSCDDSACAGETFQLVDNATNDTKKDLVQYNLAKNRYFQYNITYSNFSSTTGLRLNVENVSIEYIVNDSRPFTYYISSSGTIEMDLTNATFVNMNYSGAGPESNLTSASMNVSGSYASQIFDAGSTSKWKNISIVTEAPYGVEIGRYLNDSNLKESHPVAINTSGLVLLMHFNNETGENDSLVKDWSVEVNPERAGVQHNNGTSRGASPINKLGVFQGGFNFTAGGDEMVNISHHSSLDFVSSFSISAWIYPTHASVWQPIYAREVDVNNQMTNFFIVGEALPMDLQFSVGNDPVQSLSPPITELNKWYHVVAIFNDAADTRSIWANGVNVREQTAFTSAPTSITACAGIGDICLGLRDNGQFVMDEIAIWNRSLSADEVKNLYLRGVVRLNLSARSCDDSACSGETWTQIGNITNGSKIPANLAQNRYFQYNITYSRNATGLNGTVVVNNVSVEFVRGPTTRIGGVSAFVVQDASGADLAVIDSVGNMDIKGTLTQNVEPPTADINDFVVQNSSGGLNLVITNPEGNLLIKNSLAQNQGSLSPINRSFIIQNNTGATVAYVNSTGGLFLTGALTQNVGFG